MLRLLQTEIAEVHTEGSGYFWNNRKRIAAPGVMLIEQILAGTAFFELDGKRCAAGTGDAYVFRFGEASSYGIDTAACDTLTIRYALFTGLPYPDMVHEIRHSLGLVFALPENSEPGRRFAALVDQFKTDGLWDRFENSRQSYDLLMSLLGHGASAAVQPDRIARAREWIISNYARKVGVKEAAWEAGCSREHLTRSFSERYGISPARLIDELRLAKARQLLLISRLPVANVARRCGYADADTMGRRFKAVFGLSPSAYRNKTPG